MYKLILLAVFLSFNAMATENGDDAFVTFNVATINGVLRGIDCDPPEMSMHYHYPSTGKESPYGYALAQNCKKVYLTTDFIFPPNYEPPTHFDMQVQLHGYSFSECAPVYIVRENTVMWGHNEIHLYVCIDNVNRKR